MPAGRFFSGSFTSPPIAANFGNAGISDKHEGSRFSERPNIGIKGSIDGDTCIKGAGKGRHENQGSKKQYCHHDDGRLNRFDLGNTEDVYYGDEHEC